MPLSVRKHAGTNAGLSRYATLGLIALSSLAFAAVLKPSHASARGVCADESSTVATPAPALRASVLCLVNETRLLKGLPALQRDARLETAAQRHTDDMVNNSHALTHVGSDGSSYSQRIAAAGYVVAGADSGENIAQGQRTPLAVVDGWLRSLGHCAATFGPGIRDLGVGVNPAAASLGTPGPTWTQVFARTPSEPAPSTTTAPRDGCPYVLAPVAAGPKPTATTSNATNVTASSATVNGTANANGGGFTSYHVDHGPTSAYGSQTPERVAGTAGATVTEQLSGLSAGTHHFRVVAMNHNGETASVDRVFTTAGSPARPLVSTGAATAVTQTTATLNGSVNPAGKPTTYRFEYGTTTSYGSMTATTAAGSDTIALAVGNAVSGLVPATLYHARLVATNSDGITFGADITFMTATVPGPGPGPGPGSGSGPRPGPPASLPAIGSQPTCAYRSTRLSAQYRAQSVLASVCLVNFERVSRGIAPLYVDARLGAAAQGHADDMARRNFFSHTNPDGCDPLCRASAAGYPLATGENISAGRWTAAAAVQGWMDSPGHRSSILGTSYRTMGAGSAVGGRYGTQWVHIFGILPPAAGAVHGLEPQFQGREDPTTPSAVPAKLQVDRARVTGGALDVMAKITRRADGRSLTVTFKARGSTTRFATKVKRGRIDIDRRLSRGQRGARSGILSLRYAGREGVRPAAVRLRAASGKADLRRSTLTLADGVLSATGTISKRVRGIVRLHMEFETSAGPGEWNGRARIVRGRWSLRQALPPDARRGGYLSLQFTGYDPRGIRGEQIGKQVAGG